MSFSYENQRLIFEGIVKKYKDYVALYRMVNHGSVEGITPFADFYWRYTYISRYSDPSQVMRAGA